MVVTVMRWQPLRLPLQSFHARLSSTLPFKFLTLMVDKILIVDDDADSLKLIGLMLQRQGYEIVTASAGNPALIKAANEIPDLIILDVMMPDMDGYEVCRRLRANPETNHIPIIMFTAKTLIDDKVAGFEAGVDDYLTKPTHPTELAARIKATLQKTRGNGADMEGKPERPNTAPRRAVTIGVLGIKGGLGTTTVALNIAASLLAQNMEPIVGDFRPGNGALGLFLGHDNAKGMAAVLAKPAKEITPQLVDKALIKHQTGIRALASSPFPAESLMKFSMEQVFAVVRSMRLMGGAVILDLGSGYSPIVSQLHTHLEQLVMLVEADPASVVLARELLNELEKETPGHVSVVVASRVAHNLQPTWQDVEQALKHDIRAIVTPDPELAYEAIEAGVPAALLKPDSVLANQIGKLAQILAKPSSSP